MVANTIKAGNWVNYHDVNNIKDLHTEFDKIVNLYNFVYPNGKHEFRIISNFPGIRSQETFDMVTK